MGIYFFKLRTLRHIFGEHRICSMIWWYRKMQGPSRGRPWACARGPIPLKNGTWILTTSRYIIVYSVYVYQGIVGCTPTNVPLWEIPI